MKLSYLSLLLPFLLVACSKKVESLQPQVPEVGYVTLKTQPVNLDTSLPGRTASVLNADIRPQVSGIIQSRLFEEGSLVKAGQVLYQIDPATYIAAVKQAKADLASAKAVVASAKLKDERYQALLKIDGVAKQDADDAHAAYQQDLADVQEKEAALDTAQINLDYTKLRAPIAGRIGKSSVTPGSLVTANQTDALATIQTLDPMYVDVAQSSAQLLQLRKLIQDNQATNGSTTVSLQLEDGSTYPLKGQLKFQDITVDESTGSVTLRAQFPNPDDILLPGMYVNASLDQATLKDAILAPQQGITHDAKGQATALIIDNDNKVEQKTVVAARAIGDKWLITRGLNANDKIIVEGSAKVKNGQTVKPVSVDLSANTASTDKE